MKTDTAMLNKFEKAVLKLMQRQLPALSSIISELTFSHRELTGVGSFTNFANPHASVRVPADGPLALEVHILMPGVQHGLGAMLFFNPDSIAFLEIFTYGDAWEGNWQGFSFAEHI